MKKLIFAAFAGVCVMTSIMATPASHKATASYSVNQHQMDTIPPKDTTKMYNLVVLRDTVPPKDTTKMYNLAVLRDTVPPKDTTKMIELVALRDTIPPTDTSSKKIVMR